MSNIFFRTFIPEIILHLLARADRAIVHVPNSYLIYYLHQTFPIGSLVSPHLEKNNGHLEQNFEIFCFPHGGVGKARSGRPTEKFPNAHE